MKDLSEMKRENPLIAIVGYSGVGKTSVARGSTLTEVVSYTSRARREHEKDGIDYHFREKEWFEANKLAFETDLKVVYDHFYGALDRDLLSKDCIVIHVKDAVEYKKRGFPVFIVQILGEVRENREGRTETKAEWYKNNREYLDEVDYYILNNHHIESAVRELEKVYNERK